MSRFNARLVNGKHFTSGENISVSGTFYLYIDQRNGVTPHEVSFHCSFLPLVFLSLDHFGPRLPSSCHGRIKGCAVGEGMGVGVQVESSVMNAGKLRTKSRL